MVRGVTDGGGGVTGGGVSLAGGRHWSGGVTGRGLSLVGGYHWPGGVTDRAGVTGRGGSSLVGGRHWSGVVTGRGETGVPKDTKRDRKTRVHVHHKTSEVSGWVHSWSTGMGRHLPGGHSVTRGPLTPRQDPPRRGRRSEHDWPTPPPLASDPRETDSEVPPVRDLHPLPVVEGPPLPGYDMGTEAGSE